VKELLITTRILSTERDMIANTAYLAEWTVARIVRVAHIPFVEMEGYSFLKRSK
jgi:hypothetical protein